MADLEQNRQESLDLIQEEIDSMDVNTPLDNTKDVVDFLDRWTVIDIKEDFAGMCNTLRNGTETEKELAKLKLIVYLGKAGNDIDYNRTTIEVFTDDSGKDAIILRQAYENGFLPGYTQYTLRFEGGKWCYSQFATK